MTKDDKIWKDEKIWQTSVVRWTNDPPNTSQKGIQQLKVLKIKKYF